MPLLRRTHDRHRGVRTVEAAARTAGHIGDEPGDRPMTRHGMIQRSAAGAPPPATDPRVSMVIIEAEGVASGRAPCRQCRAAGRAKRSVRINPAASRRRSRHPRHQPKIEISIALACGPRVPSSGTFVRLPAPETLHASGLAASGHPKNDSGRPALSRLRPDLAYPKTPIGRRRRGRIALMRHGSRCCRSLAVRDL